MPQADIEINAVAASNEDLPINVLVQLSNNDVGDETTYDWSIIDQPVGAADALSATNIENPTLTPLKEDTYLLQLIVDQGLPGESIDRKLFRVRRLKTDAVLVAKAETTEGTQGAWSLPQNETLAKVLNHVYDGEVVVARAGGPLTAGAAVQLDETVTIKAGLPGAERVPRANLINATDAQIAAKVVGIAISKPDGDPTILVNDMVLVRTTGLLDLPNVGTPTIGDSVFINDSGVLSLVQGTNRKKIGTVIDDTAGAWRAFLSTLTEEGGTHAIGGGFHIADSLANLNAKVTGGNLDFDTAPRPGISSIASALGSSTTSLIDVLVAGMTLTPAAGDYLVWFTASVEHSTNNASIFANIYSGGVIEATSEREYRRGTQFIETSVACAAKVTVNGAQAIEGRWRTTAGTALKSASVLMILKVA